MKMRTIVSALALLSSYALMGAIAGAETTVPAPTSGEQVVKVNETPQGNPLLDTLLGHPADNGPGYDLLQVGKALDDSIAPSLTAIDEDAIDPPGTEHGPYDVTVVPFPEGIWAALACLPMILIGRWLFRRPT
jgi:hypothetical protein